MNSSIEPPPSEYSSAAVAKFILRHAKQEVSHLKLHKLLYYIQGNCYRMFGVPLIREDFQAWQYGPVEATLYREIGARGTAPLCPNDIVSQDYLDETCYDWSWLKSCLNFLEGYSPSQLVRMSHASKTPWDVIYKDGKGRYEIIPKQLIELFFVTR